MFDWLNEVSKQYPTLSLILGVVIVASMGLWQLVLLHKKNKERDETIEFYKGEIDRLSELLEMQERKHKAELRRNNSSNKQTIDVLKGQLAIANKRLDRKGKS